MITLTCTDCGVSWDPDDTASPGEPDLCASCWDAHDPRLGDVFAPWVDGGQS